MELTAREREVLRLVAAGQTSADIAVRLRIARTTVETLVRSALLRLGVRTRRQAAALEFGNRAAPVPLHYEQRALLTLLAEGASLAEAAACLNVSRRTACRRLAAARDMLGVATTAEALVVAGLSASKPGGQPARRQKNLAQIVDVREVRDP